MQNLENSPNKDTLVWEDEKALESEYRGRTVSDSSVV